jgi:EmrB/QacA subfamily drug resistance transporter
MTGIGESPAAPARDQLGHPDQARRGLALAVLCTATLMIILDGTIVTVALPSIQRGLGFTATGLTWVINAYLIAFGGLLLLAGKLGDRHGRRRVFRAGLTLFALASLACGLATGPALLVSARFAQGIGGAMVTAVSLGMIVTLYAEPRARARAIGVYSFVGAGGASIGLVLGGVITQAAGWHWIFFVNVPLALVSTVAAGRLLAPGRDRNQRGRVDVPGAALVTSGLMVGVLAVVGSGSYGWRSAHTVVLGAAALLLLAGFAAREATATAPLLPLRMLAVRQTAGANLAQMLVIGAAFGFQVLITLYMQRVLGYSAAASGLGLVPTAAVIGAVSVGCSARLNSRFGARVVLLTGLSLILAALLLLTRMPVHGHYLADLLPALLVFGLGGGLTLPALVTLGMSGVTDADAGLASGLFNTSQQAGAAAGVALLSTVAAARTASLLGSHQPPAVALTGGYRAAFLLGAGMSAAALVLAATVLRRPAAGLHPADGSRPASASNPASTSGPAGASNPASTSGPAGASIPASTSNPASTSGPVGANNAASASRAVR